MGKGDKKNLESEDWCAKVTWYWGLGSSNTSKY